MIEISIPEKKIRDVSHDDLLAMLQPDPDQTTTDLETTLQMANTGSEVLDALLLRAEKIQKNIGLGVHLK